MKILKNLKFWRKNNNIKKYFPNFDIIKNHFNELKDSEYAVLDSPESGHYYEVNNIKITINFNTDYDMYIKIFLLNPEDRKESLLIANAIFSDYEDYLTQEYENGTWDNKIQELLIRMDSEVKADKMVYQENINKAKQKEQEKINKFNKIYG